VIILLAVRAAALRAYSNSISSFSWELPLKIYLPVQGSLGYSLQLTPPKQMSGTTSIVELAAFTAILFLFLKISTDLCAIGWTCLHISTPPLLSSSTNMLETQVPLLTLVQQTLNYLYSSWNTCIIGKFSAGIFWTNTRRSHSITLTLINFCRTSALTLINFCRAFAPSLIKFSCRINFVASKTLYLVVLFGLSCICFEFLFRMEDNVKKLAISISNSNASGTSCVFNLPLWCARIIFLVKIPQCGPLLSDWFYGIVGQLAGLFFCNTFVYGRANKTISLLR